MAALNPNALVPITANGASFLALIDTGATQSYVTLAAIKSAGLPLEPAPTPHAVRLGDGRVTQIDRVTICQLHIDKLETLTTLFVLEDAPAAFILGNTFLKEHDILVRPGQAKIFTMDNKISLRFSRTGANFAASLVTCPDFHIEPSLSAAQQQQIRALLKEDYFSSDSRPFGRSKHVTHKITLLPNARPIHRHPKPMSPLERELVRKQVDEYLRLGIIRPSSSPWANRVVIAPKKDGESRFCVNYRPLNDQTVKDKWPLPNQSELLEHLKGSRYLTTLDAASGYWQIPMDEDSIPLTAFTCAEGLFEWLVMPFGLSTAPNTYQRYMALVFGGLLWRGVLIYIDDIIIYSSDWDEHLRLLADVLARLKEHNLLLKMKKCSFAKVKTEYLGHVVSGEGLYPMPQKLEKLRDFPVPSSVREVRAFVGLASYYRKFIPDFTMTVNPLYVLTSASSFEWTPECQKAFDVVRHAIMDNAVLHMPIDGLPFIVDTDASEVGMAGILSQVVDGKEMIVLFEARKFTAAERRWHIREKEALAIVEMLEKCRRFILGRKFSVRTDHQSLTGSFLTAKEGRLGRWSLRLEEFKPFPIYYRKSQLHANVDAFTRIFAESDGFDDRCFPLAALQHKIDLPTSDDLRVAQEADPRALAFKASLAADIRDGVVGRRIDGNWKPFLPQSLQKDTIRKLHESMYGCHYGAKRTFDLLRRLYCFKGGRQETYRVVADCAPCNARKPPHQRLDELRSRPPSVPWAVVACDFAGPYSVARSGNRYVLVFTDHFTKWTEMIPTKDMLKETVCAEFLRNIVLRHGTPEKLLSDQGPQFKSNLLDAICTEFGVKKIFSSTYYPQGDGYAERMMRTMNDSLAILARGDPSEWDTYLPAIAFAYNTTEHAATGISPFLLNHGRLPAFPASHDLDPLPPGDTTALAHARRVRHVVRDAVKRARAAIEGYWANYKRRYDKHRRPIELTKGDWVLVRLSKHEREKFPCLKLAPRWSRPAQIIRVLSSANTFVLSYAHEPAAEHTVNLHRLLPISIASYDQWVESQSPVLPPPPPPSRSASDPLEDVFSDVDVIPVPFHYVPWISPSTVPWVAPPPTPSSTRATESKSAESLQTEHLVTESVTAPSILPLPVVRKSAVETESLPTESGLFTPVPLPLPVVRKSAVETESLPTESGLFTPVPLPLPVVRKSAVLTESLPTESFVPLEPAVASLPSRKRVLSDDSGPILHAATRRLRVPATSSVALPSIPAPLHISREACDAPRLLRGESPRPRAPSQPRVRVLAENEFEVQSVDARDDRTRDGVAKLQRQKKQNK